MAITIETGVTMDKGIVVGDVPIVVPGTVHTVAANGNGKVSTAQVKFGTGSYSSNNLFGFLRVTPLTDLAWGTGDFTMEFWVYPTSLTALQTLIGMRPVGNEGAYPCIYINTNGTVNWYIFAANRITSATGVLTLNAWNSIAVSRASNSTRLFVNGTQTGSTFADTYNYNAGACLIGANDFVGTGQYPVQGYIDEVRFSNIARYTSNYTPATGPFATDANTVLLIHCDGTNASTTFTDASHTV